MIETLQYFCIFQKIFPVSSYLFPIISFMVTVSLLKRAWTVDSTEHVLVLLPWWFIIKEFGWHRIFWKWNFLWRNRWNLEKSHNFRILRSYWLTSANGKQRLKTCNFIKKRLQNWCSSCHYWEIFKNTFFTAHLRWLLLYTEWMNFLCVYFLFSWSNCRVT